MTRPLLVIENLSLRRNGHDILHGVNLSVNPGQVHVLLGLNGSGKSSLAYVIMGCEGYTPDSGRIVFDGRDLAGLSITDRARLGITLAWQEPARYEGLPSEKYIGVGVREKEKEHERVAAALEAVALPPRVYGVRAADRTLSGGERKRVELAAVYAMRPRLAILDEPDSGIDVLTLGDIQRLIRRLADEGSAVLLITHREELTTTADVASLMCFGSILWTAEPGEARRHYAARCRLHVERLGAQPWDADQPEVRAALASNGIGAGREEA
jgi:Fe-S cluster assembly ATP-binding protein